MEEKKPTGDSKIPGKENSKMPGSDNTSKNQSNSSGEKDEKAETLVRDADEAVTKFASDNRPALKYYREVLKADPKNEEALKNKKQIEDIYESMGMPIPQ